MSDLVSSMRRIRDGEKKVLGCSPLYPPVELFHAMEITPVTLWCLKSEINGTMESDKHVQDYACSVARHLTEFVLTDAGELLDGLFMYNACDTIRNMPEILERGLRESGRSLPLASMHIPAISLNHSTGVSYLRDEISGLISNLEKSFQKTFSGRRFARSVSLYRKTRELAAQLESLVADRRLPFNAFREIVSSSHFLPVEEQLSIFQAAVRDYSTPKVPETEPVTKGVILSGILPPPPSTAAAIEECGLTVVGNDIAPLRRSYACTPEPDEDPVRYYTDFYRLHFPCPTLLNTADRRLETLLGLIRETGARGFIYLGEKYCECEYFELPFIEKTLREKGVKTLSLEFSLDDTGDSGAIRTRIEAFAELLDDRS